MNPISYTSYAYLYDLFNRKKDYSQESEFLDELFLRYQIKTVLDAGCGTGTHLGLLQQRGYFCMGMDINQDMLDIARGKVTCELIRGDILNFELGKRFDAVICMYAVLNHLISSAQAENALACFKRHLNSSGIVVIDLHNPQSSGIKCVKIGGIERRMEWIYDPLLSIEETKTQFTWGNEKTAIQKITDQHKMHIYSIQDMHTLLHHAGFSHIQFYQNYCFKEADFTSKNIICIGRT